MPTSFAKKVETAFEKYGQLCVGIDPHAALLSDWGLDDNVTGLEEFANRALDAAVGRVGIIKPQVSFFERHGSAGFAVLEKLAERAAATDVVVIMDAKRGDIGTTMDAYFDAWLGANAPFVCDALTVSPYLGFDSLKPLMKECLERGKGLFVLSATSNPEGAALQRATTGNETIAAQIWHGLGEINRVTAGPNEKFGSFGAVLGATLNLNSFGLSSVLEGQASAGTLILAPGFGAQGAELSASKILFGAASAQTLHSVSRSVLSAGANGMAKAIDAAKAELVVGLG
ncbi:orotidine-5'-phosphate decarboxylase [Rhodoluna sp.]|uniref:orotidine-5'-phosphate decarboxylase n=1 Tax=Rhodoluna sp. TaxID=1969481 RepID=UPI0025DA3DC7|nr:orotidine-5'-phosphate decarboxylase [Rhodoluna sp.]